MSALTIRCPCGKRLIVKPELVGRTVLCPACHAALSVSAPVEEAPRRQSALVASIPEAAPGPALTLPSLEDEAPPEEAPPRRINGWTLLLVGVLLFNLGVLGYFLIWQPLRDRNAQPGPGTEASLDAVVNDYSDSTRVGDRRWKGKRLRVTGLVMELKTPDNVSPHVWLAASPTRYLCCFFPSSQKEAFDRLSGGDRIVLDGDLTAVEPKVGGRSNLFLHNCRVISMAVP